MKVIEKYLTMNKKEQVEDCEKFINENGLTATPRQLIHYLNSEVKDPLEKLGYKKLSNTMWQYKHSIIEIKKGFEMAKTYYDDSSTTRMLSYDELKAILEIMEVTE